MSYRTERGNNGRTCLVIDGWEKGIADSPYNGISSLKNLNISFLTGATYVNYKRQAVSLSGGGTMGRPMFYTQSPGTSPTYYILDDKGQVWVGTSGATVWTLLTGNHTGASGLGYGIAYFKNYLFVFGPNYIDVCGNGTGPGGITSGNWADIGSSGYYFINQTAVQLVAAPSPGDDTLILSSPWAFTSGEYQVIIGGGLQTVTGTFTNGDDVVPINPVVSVMTAIDTIDVRLFPAVSPDNHMALVAINDVLYFCNGNFIGSISVPQASPNAVFNVSDFSTMEVDYSALTLRETDRSIWLAEINQNLQVAVQNYIYSWDKTSTVDGSGNVRQTYSATPINENPSRMINILNNLYIFAGQKGNLYISNGYSVSLFKKIPDSFLGVIDPYWVIGGMMFHRNKLWFGGLGSDVNTTTKVQGIFSLVLSTGISNSEETTGAINFESQNSYGSNPTMAADATGILIDLNAVPSTTLGSGSVDRYASAFYNNTVGGIDYNDSTLWANYEPVIETDLIPIGTFLQSRTFENAEYKLDRPLAQGDSIRLSYRTSFNGSYTALGTSEVTGDVAAPGTTTATATASTQVLSDNFNSQIQNAQWVQFKIEFKCASSNSSFIRLREMRLYYLL